MSNLVAHDSAASIAAGGIVPVGAKLPEDQRSSPVKARAYSHPALDGKTIVRLEPDAVAAGTDAEMAAFGFEAPKTSKPLGLVRFRTLGFPAWALIHDPKKAKAALDVTDDFRKAKRLVAAKPGHAKDAFEKIAKQLQRSAPQFLPSFWEEAGRAVADQASSTMAAQCFEKARQAERAYKLKTNADDSDAVFVEFALLGALSAKTLSAYAKELAKSAGGKEAYRRYRAIIIKRALGGMPPYSGMGKDLRALAEAAGANVEAESDKLVVELLDAPGVAKAPVEFWTTYRDTLTRLAKTSFDLRMRLRAIWPAPRGGTDETRAAFKTTWLEILTEAGALEAIPDENLAAWVSRLIRYAGASPRVAEIVRDLAPRLAKLGQPVQVVVEGDWGSEELSLDLAELVLSLGIALADPPERDDFSTDWMTCDPVRVAADNRYSKKLVGLLSRYIGDKDHEHKMSGKQGFVAARRLWVEEQIAELDLASLPGCADALDVLDEKTTPEMFLPFQDLHAKLTHVDLSHALVNQLRGGSIDEFGWPAYEQAVATLGDVVGLGGAFPIACAWNASKAIAISKDGVVAEHDLVYKPKEHKVDGVMYLDGEFLVVLNPEKGWQEVAYWSSKPKQRFDLEHQVRGWGGDVPTVWTVPSGGVSIGGKAFRAGEVPGSGMESFVATRDKMWHADGAGFREYDPATGKNGAVSAPPFLGEWTPRPDWKLESTNCVLVPAPDGLASSPLGMRDGLLGLRLRMRQPANTDDWSDQPNEIERIDGLRVETTIYPFAMLAFPGDDQPRLVMTEQASNKCFLGGEGPGAQIWLATGKSLGTINGAVWAARGWGVPVPAAAFWDFLTPRDAAGSHALRTITIDAARAILDAARIEVAAGGETGKRALPLTEAAIRSVRPAITDGKLIRGVAGIVERAAELANRLATIAAERAKEHADPSGQGLSGEGAQLRKLATALAGARPIKIPDFDIDLAGWLKHGRARAALSLTPLATDDDRRKTRDVVRGLVGTILADDLSKMRILELEEPDDYNDDTDWGTLVVKRIDGSLFALHASNNWALELSLDGSFRVPQPYKLSKETRLDRGIGTEWAQTFLAMSDERIAWDPAIAELVAKRADISLAEATLLFNGVPERDNWSKDFLGKQRRELVGLKMGDADAARTTFRDMEEDKLFAVYNLAVPDDPKLVATPLAPGGFAERLADAWKAKHGKRAKVPQELIAAAKKELEVDDEFGAILAAFAGDDDAWFLKPDLRSFMELGGWEEKPGFNAKKARELVTFIGWLFLQRPVGCAIRAGIPHVVERMRKVLDDPRVIWRFEDLYVEEDKPKGKAHLQSLVDLVGGKPVEMPDDDPDQKAVLRDDGAACIIATSGGSMYAGFRPAKLDKRTAEKVNKLALLMVDEENTWQEPPTADLAIVQLVKDALAALAARVEKTDVPEDQYEANPLVSAKKLVTKVAKDLGISDDAAALYLQTLALAEPTQQKVQLWNGWKPKQYAEAAKELAKKKLVTEGKRERAGRTIFLKGGYAKGDGKNLPMEEWKQPFYVLPRHVITEPVHALFARAYKRIEDGDKP